MSIKAQTPREPILPSRAPTTLLQAGARGQACTPQPGRGGNTARPAMGRNPKPARPLFTTHQSISYIGPFGVISRVALESS